MKKLLFCKKKNKTILTSLIFLFFLSFSFTFANDAGSGLIGIIYSIVIFIIDILKYIVSIFFQVSATIFDNLLLISLNTYLLDQDFVKIIWINLRDFANSIFVIGAVYLAFNYMKDDKNIQKNILYLIIAIFTLNFSLFFSKLIIDAGNLTATVFYSPMAVEVIDENGKPVPDYFALANAIYKKTYEEQKVKNQKSGDVNKAETVKVEDFRSVALALHSLIKIESEFLEKTKDQLELNNEKNKDSQKNNIYEQYIIFNIFVIFVYFIFAKHFFVAGFMFIGRLAGLLYLMVASPLFFAGLFIPSQGRNTFINKWFFPICQKSFCIVVYLFFLWLAILVLASDLVKEIENIEGYGTTEKEVISFVMINALKIIFASVLLDMAKKYGQKFCEGELGSTFGKFTKAVGSVASVASVAFNPIGSLAKAGTRRFVGVTGKALGESKYLERHYAKGSGKGVGGFFAGAALRSGKKLQDLKIGGISDRDEQNKRIKVLNEIQASLSDKNQDILARRRYKNLNTEFVEGFIDAKKNRKYQDYLDQVKNGKTERERKEAKEKAEGMIKKSNIVEMGISKNALRQGKMGAFAAAFMPAIAARRYREEEYNEGRRKAVETNEKITEARKERKEVERKFSESSSDVKRDAKFLEDLITTGKFDINNKDQERHYSKEILEELKNNTEVMEGFTEFSENIKQKKEQIKDLDLKSNINNQKINQYTQGAKSVISDIKNVNYDNFDKINKNSKNNIKEILGESDAKKFFQDQNNLAKEYNKISKEMDNAKSNLEFSKQEKKLKAIKEKIDNQRSKTIENIEQKKKNSKTYKELFEQKENIEKDKKIISNQIEKDQRKIKDSVSKFKDSFIALLKAEKEQSAAILDKKTSSAEDDKRNSLARSKDGDIATVTEADAQIHT